MTIPSGRSCHDQLRTQRAVPMLSLFSCQDSRYFLVDPVGDEPTRRGSCKDLPLTPSEAQNFDLVAQAGIAPT